MMWWAATLHCGTREAGGRDTHPASDKGLAGSKITAAARKHLEPIRNIMQRERE